MPLKNKIYLSIVGFFFCIAASRGQDYYGSTYDHKPVSFGITFAPHVDWLRYGDTEGYKSSTKIGYSYGLIADFAFSENYYFASGLTINTMQQASEYGGLKTDYRLQYAEIPIAVKLKSTQRYYRSYYGLFGFTAGIRLSDKLTHPDDHIKYGADANLLRLGLQIGGGVEWLLDHNLRFMTGITYNNGFTRAVKEGEPRNSYAAVNLAIMF